ncbi:MAG: orotate phosphoribosyltransferase [Candidatus Marinimicrobia bacterium]|jgi:orotate phosphoribosyltransferase|nr:orotate phosphoribosyltransferase [Candidatus Neomarinimicrobiota bacterium]MDP6611758.1 orotate phosphoribosyltransferase [Candidatus Neomarinimicrobiota bacterium]|tara:strand:- start:91779 stop:92351 length:573 start_codon:yes stop_codon:yes gene_type:complete
MANYIEIFKQTGALLEGHFILTSGRHSPSYFQCAKVLQHPGYLSAFSQKIADHFEEMDIDTVISPAVGGIVIGTEVGRTMGKRTIFAERENGKMTLRRGFNIDLGEKVLVVEDVITTGGSVKEVMDVVEAAGGIVVGVAVIVDRSNGKVLLHENQFSLVPMEAISYSENEIPTELAAIPVQKPGSRSLKK